MPGEGNLRKVPFGSQPEGTMPCITFGKLWLKELKSASWPWYPESGVRKQGVE